ncbi:hypothetical protein SLS56_005127 [Neofusicoccum ribis]|uniref:GPI anchored protein n=1 Tax=Neofusicoccum ribis TaxID=45134 RepID=A0ABR3SUY9_9PEZI
MQYHQAVLLALASSAMASPKLVQRQDDSAASTTLDANSIASVLYTALPSSLLAIAITDQSAVSSIIASEVAAGTPQPWISALPSDVQAYLTEEATGGSSITAAPTAATTPSGNSTASAASSIISGIVAGNSSANATATRSSSGSSSSSGASTTSGSSSETTGSGSSGASSSSTGGASIPTMIGAGLAGVFGMVGMLAL